MANTLKVNIPKKKTPRFDVGTYWRMSDDDSSYYYILAQDGDKKFIAINVITGSRWLDADKNPEAAVRNLEFVGDVELTIKVVN